MSYQKIAPGDTAPHPMNGHSMAVPPGAGYATPTAPPPMAGHPAMLSGHPAMQGGPGSFVPPPMPSCGGPGMPCGMLPAGPGSYTSPPPHMVVRNGSYVPAPIGAPGPDPRSQQRPPPAGLPPGGPPSLTQGIPDPAAIARQKEVYLKMLDDQLKQGINVLDQQVKYQRDYLTVQCEQQKKQFLLQLDQQMKAQEMVLTQQYNEQLMALQMQAGTQKAALEQQSMQLSMEYEQRKAEEHMYRQQYEIQQQQTEMAVKMARDYQRMSPTDGRPAGPAPHEVPQRDLQGMSYAPMPGVGGGFSAWPSVPNVHYGAAPPQYTAGSPAMAYGGGLPGSPPSPLPPTLNRGPMN